MFEIRDGRDKLYQWDIDRQVIVNDETITQVHFCNKTDDCSLVVDVKSEDGVNVANVPNVLLQDAMPIKVYGYDINYTKFCEVFKVVGRSKPSDYVYTETEIVRYSDLEERINQIEENGISDDVVTNAIEGYLEENPIDIPVDSVNGKTGAVELTAADVGALPDSTEIPSIEGLATVDYVDEAVGNIEITSSGGVGKAGKGYLAEIFNYEEYSNYASGNYAHAEGRYVVASGNYSHAEGLGTAALGQCQHTQGKYNIEDKDEKGNALNTYAHIVGNGTSTNRSNAHTLDWDGNAWFAGNVYVGGTSMDDATLLGSGGGGGLTEEDVNALIDTKLSNIGVAEEGAY